MPPQCNDVILAVPYRETMPPRISPGTPEYVRTYIREWREDHNLSQDRLVERVRERVESFSKSSLSRLENGKQPYSQPILEAIAWALGREDDPGALLRLPHSPENEIAAHIMRLDAAKRAQALRIIKAMAEDEAA